MAKGDRAKKKSAAPVESGDAKKVNREITPAAKQPEAIAAAAPVPAPPPPPETQLVVDPAQTELAAEKSVHDSGPAPVESEDAKEINHEITPAAEQPKAIAAAASSQSSSENDQGAVLMDPATEDEERILTRRSSNSEKNSDDGLIITPNQESAAEPDRMSDTVDRTTMHTILLHKPAATPIAKATPPAPIITQVSPENDPLISAAKVVGTAIGTAIGTGANILRQLTNTPPLSSQAKPRHSSTAMPAKIDDGWVEVPRGHKFTKPSDAEKFGSEAHRLAHELFGDTHAAKLGIPMTAAKKSKQANNEECCIA